MPAKAGLVGYAERLGPRAEATAQKVDEDALAIVQPSQQAGVTWPHWRAQAAGFTALDRREDGFADARQEMHVVVAVDEIRRPAERRDEGLDLRLDFARDQGAVESRPEGADEHVGDRKERPVLGSPARMR